MQTINKLGENSSNFLHCFTIFSSYYSLLLLFLLFFCVCVCVCISLTYCTTLPYSARSRIMRARLHSVLTIIIWLSFLYCLFWSEREYISKNYHYSSGYFFVVFPSSLFVSNCADFIRIYAHIKHIAFKNE